MPSHVVAFWEDQDHAGVLSNIAAAGGEQVLFTNGDDIRIPDDLTNVVAIAAMVGLGATEARLVAPSLRRFINPQIVPLNSLADADTEPDSPQKVHDLRANPFVLEPSEALNAQTDSDTAAAAMQSVIVWLSDGPISPLVGQQIHSVRCTAAITAVAGSWTNGQLTFAQDLPAGSFQVVGMRAQGATMIAARLVFRGGAARPGVLGADIESDIEWPGFRYGGMGVLGEFDINTPPTLDVLCNVADTAQALILDLIQLG